MDCSSYQKKISQMLDGELSAAEQDALQEHLRLCPDCRRTLAAFTAVSEALRGELAEPPAALMEGVMEAVAAHETKKIVPLKRRRGARSLAVLAACAAVAVGLGLLASRSGLLPSRAAGADNAAAPAAARYVETEEAAVEEPAAAEAPAPEAMENERMESAALDSADAGAASLADGCPVYDADGASLGVIPESLIGSFLDGVCITDGTALPEAAEEADYRVDCEGLVYELFARDGRLWWRSDNAAAPCLSPATEEEFLSLFR